MAVLSLASGCDWFDDPSTVEARNRIRRAQAQRIETQSAIAEREAEQSLLFAAQRHEMTMTMQWVVLSVTLTVGACVALTYSGVGAHRIYTESKRRYCLARAQTLKAEAALTRERRLEAEVLVRLMEEIAPRKRKLLKEVA